MNTREYWIQTLLSIANPVFESLSAGCLHRKMPVETNGDSGERASYARLEVVGRSLAGIGSWLNLKNCSAEEFEKKNRLTRLVCESLKQATDSQSKDYLNFTEGGQPLVDAAFLAQGLLRSWDAVWLKLDRETQSKLISGFQSTRSRKPAFCNWLLFSAMIEVFLFKAGADWDRMRVDYALRQHEQWYKGDGAYGDGPEFHWDYYNSFVIQPMLYDIVYAGGEISDTWYRMIYPITQRIQRYACILERMIAPDGSFPPIGRSLTYRFGAFHALGLVSLESILPGGIQPAAVRCALTAVIRRMMEAKGTFDSGGWLRIGFCGYQPSLGEAYISTGSLYLCLCGLLPLGLPEAAPFWSDPDMDWTSRRIWNGEDHTCDHELKE